MSGARAIEAEAARWLVRREEAGWSDADEQVFGAWMEESLAHKAAYWRLEYAWAQADRIRALGPDALRSASGGAEAIEQISGIVGGRDDIAASEEDPDTSGPGGAIAPGDGASDEGTSGNVIPFPPRLFKARRWAGSGRSVIGRRVAAAVIAVGLVSGAILWRAQGPAPAIPGRPASELIAAATPPSDTIEVATALGKRKIVRLRDGSRIELNTATTIKTRMEGPAREVWLEDGEAYFEVKHANNQPFVVHAGSRNVTVLGTKFTVSREGDRVKVAVVEGRVRVDDARRDAPLRSNVITAGDIVLVRGGDTLLSEGRPREVERDLAWRTGMIGFHRQTLGEAAAEFNRYNTVKLEIADPETAAIRIGGTFRASNVDAFARLLQEAYGLKVEQSAGKIVVSN
jgi:transmembrane sensor